jgi:hypothetical protein
MKEMLELLSLFEYENQDACGEVTTIASRKIGEGDVEELDSGSGVERADESPKAR